MTDQPVILRDDQIQLTTIDLSDGPAWPSFLNEEGDGWWTRQNAKVVCPNCHGLGWTQSADE